MFYFSMNNLFFYISLSTLGICIFFSACHRNKEEKNLPPVLEKGKALAQFYCTGCHIFPEPELLDRRTWLYNVLPNMGRRLGMTHHSIFDYPPVATAIALDSPLLRQDDWETLVSYYSSLAPKSLNHQKQQAVSVAPLQQFEVYPFSASHLKNPVISLLKMDTVASRIIVGDGVANQVYMFAPSGDLIQSISTESAPVVMAWAEGVMSLITVGILPPSDSAMGKIVRYKKEGSKIVYDKDLIKSLYRPVDAILGDLNQDTALDWLICGFGNNVGRLSWFEKINTEAYQEHILADEPGAIKAYLHDFNQDSLPDIIVLFAQGDEKIAIYYNKGKGNFQREVTLRFSPVFGSIYFELHDFNRDGHQDILYVNGDNGDYSNILKNYHGIRIFMNDGKNSFTETFFYPLYGACRAKASDFDQDGDMDIIASATFVENTRFSQRGIVYLENSGGFDFKTYAIKEAINHPWNTIDVGDIDRDGDQDILIGAMDARYYYGVQGLVTTNEGKSTAILFLENNLNQ